MGLGVKAYDPAAYIVTLAGFELKGYGPSSKIVGTFPEKYTVVVGLDGEVGRTKTNNKTSLWKLSLLQTSVSNRSLMNIFLNDDGSLAGTVVPYFMKNLNGDTLVMAASAWIVGEPEFNLAGEVGVNEWSIQCGETIVYIGGQDQIGA